MSLYLRMVQLIVPLVFFTALIILMAVWNSTSKTVHKNIYGSLKGVSAALSAEVEEFANNKRKQLSLLLQNADINALFANNARNRQINETIEQLNLNFVILNKNNQKYVRDGANNTLSVSDRSALENAYFYDPINYISINDRVYLVIGHQPANARTSEPAILMGLLLGNELINEFSRESGLHLSLILPETGLAPITTIKNIDVRAETLFSGIVSESYYSLFSPRVLFGFQPLYTYEKPLTPMVGSKASIFLSINADRVSRNFVELQTTIALLALGAVVIAALFGFYVASRISKPLENLALDASNIAKGNYKEKLKYSHYSREFEQLQTAFEQMRQSIARREQQIVEQSNMDFVTPLYNRSYMKRYIEQALGEKRSFQAVVIAINDFKQINSVFGNEASDLCLIEMAKRITALKGLAARLEGGRFLWLSFSSNQREQLQSIKSHLELPIEHLSLSVNVHTSMGVLECPEQAPDVETLIRRLVILIEASIESKGAIRYFDLTLENSSLRKLDIVTKLKNALVHNQEELSIAYQPYICLRKRSCSNLEALLRWENPDLGFVGPTEFIPLAENAGLINDITAWVTKTVLKDIKRFNEAGHELTVSINISPQDLLNHDFPAFCKKQLKKHGLLSACICFELTESSILQEPEEAIACLDALKSIGFSIAIDDFGTGYSSLSYLTDLPADLIKIDRSFIKSISSSKDSEKVCKRIIQIARDLDLEIVAEGIEESANIEWLIENDCDFGQGFYICKPSTADETLKWLKAKLETEKPLLY